MIELTDWKICVDCYVNLKRLYNLGDETLVEE